MFVQFPVETATDESSLAHRNRGVLADAWNEKGDQVVEGLQPGGDVRQERRGDRLERRFDGRHGTKGAGQGQQIARSPLAEGDPGDQALDVEDLGEFPAKESQQFGIIDQGPDGIVATGDRLDVAQRPDDPLAEEAGAHRRPGVVEDRQESSGTPAGGRRPDEFQIALGGRVHRQEAATDEDQRADMRQVALLGGRGIGEDRPCGADEVAGRGWHAEGVKAGDAEMFQQEGGGFVGGENRLVDAGYGRRMAGHPLEPFGDDGLVGGGRRCISAGSYSTSRLTTSSGDAPGSSSSALNSPVERSRKAMPVPEGVRLTAGDDSCSGHRARTPRSGWCPG